MIILQKTLSEQRAIHYARPLTRARGPHPATPHSKRRDAAVAVRGAGRLGARLLWSEPVQRGDALSELHDLLLQRPAEPMHKSLSKTAQPG